MPRQVEGKVAFCTAAGAGIGRATAIALGARRRQGHRHRPERCPARRPEGGGRRASAPRSTRATPPPSRPWPRNIGPVDVLFNARRLRAPRHGARLQGDKDWDFSFDLNVKSMHRTIQAFLPGMLAKGKGFDHQHRLDCRRQQGRPQPLRVRRPPRPPSSASPRPWPWTSSARASAATASAPAPSRRRRSKERVKALGATGRRRGEGAQDVHRSPAHGPARPRRGDGPRRRLSRLRQVRLHDRLLDHPPTAASRCEHLPLPVLTGRGNSANRRITHMPRFAANLGFLSPSCRSSIASRRRRKPASKP